MDIGEMEKIESDTSVPRSRVTAPTTVSGCVSFDTDGRIRQSFTAVLLCDSEHAIDTNKQVTFVDINNQKYKGFKTKNPLRGRKFIIEYSAKNNETKLDSFEMLQAQNTVHSDKTDRSPANDKGGVIFYTKDDSFRRHQQLKCRCKKDKSKESRSVATEQKEEYTEKTTYCRPVLNLYNKDYVYKFTEKKHKLRELVHKIIEAREKEKQMMAWDKYIKDLKLKHEVIDSKDEPTTSSVPFKDNFSLSTWEIEDNYKTRIMKSQTGYCNSLLRELYERDSTPHIMELIRKNIAVNTDTQQQSLPLFFEPNPYFCYPSSSQGRMNKHNARNSCDIGHPSSRTYSEQSSGSKYQNFNRPFRGDIIKIPHCGVSRRIPPKPYKCCYKSRERPKLHRSKTTISHENEQTDNLEDSATQTEGPSLIHKEHIRSNTKIIKVIPDSKKVGTKRSDAQVPIAIDPTILEQNKLFLSKDDPSKSVEEKIEQYKNEQTITVDSAQGTKKLNLTGENAQGPKTLSLKEEFVQVSNIVATLKENNNNQQFDSNVLESIENKLDLLIIAINSLIVENKEINSSTCKDECISTKPFCFDRDYTFAELTKGIDVNRKSDKKPNYRCIMSDCTSGKCKKRRKMERNEKKCDEDCLGIEKVEQSTQKDYETTQRDNETTQKDEDTNQNVKEATEKSINLNEAAEISSNKPAKTKIMQKLPNAELPVAGPASGKFERITDLFMSNVLVDKGSTKTVSVNIENRARKEIDEIEQKQDRIRLTMEKIKKLLQCSNNTVDVNGISIIGKLARETTTSDYTLKRKVIENNGNARGGNEINLNETMTEAKPGSNDTEICENVLQKSLKSQSSSYTVDEQNTYGFRKNPKFFCGVVTDDPSLAYRSNADQSKIDKILTEEMDKSDQAKRDIEDILNGEPSRQCAVQINFDVPTRERCTEVTESLSRTRLAGEIMQEFAQTTSIDSNRTITIAVNTDPLSLLALFRVSTDTIRQLLSYMQQINYGSFLPSISRPLALTNQVMTSTQYQCHICGTSFEKPSQLADHLRDHDGMSTRDCCVCRHLLDVQRRREPIGLFACEYCGQCFTRAYCCELHQQTCARNAGRRHDVPESLAILR